MAQYIDADSLLKRMFPYDLVDKKQYALNAQAVYNVIESSSVADVVEVVRCKDCKHCERGICYYPKVRYVSHDKNHFCGYGEKKGGAE